MNRTSRSCRWVLCACLAWPIASLDVTPLRGGRAYAADYFLTIGGGYTREANQASLEANVLFFQQVLIEKHHGPRTQATFFSDGIDSTSDLQVLAKTASTGNSSASSTPDTGMPDTGMPDTDMPVTALLEQLYSFRGGGQSVEYRNHKIPNVSGANIPASIHASLRSFSSSLSAGDRLIVFVTAHGSEAKGRNPYNTTISCWNNQQISAREFAGWLNDVPLTVPVVMVMAQCYCGGFAHAIFSEADSRQSFADGVRVGFFAQQHDLPAAGCRPDIENDEEYSSFFWGAFVGRTRNGKELPSADYNRDQKISFAEAHAQAVLFSETIDIPLRTSEAVLRAFSRIAGYDHRRRDDERTDERPDERPDDSADDSNNEEPSDTSAAELAAMVGTLSQIMASAGPELKSTVRGLAQQLGIDEGAQVPEVFARFEELRQRGREIRRTGFGSRRSRGSGRRELREEISQSWPELGEDDWRNADVLRSDQAELMVSIRDLPSYPRFRENQQRREAAATELEQLELREVKFQRLINTLEAIVLAENLPRTASPEIVQRYQQMLTIEQGTLAK